MSRKEFMEQLEKLLMDIPQEERQEALTYYQGYFEDAGEENEASIIKELESPEAVAAIIKADIGVEEGKQYTKNGYGDAGFTQNKEAKDSSYSADTAGNGSGSNENNTSRTVLLVIVAVLTSPLWVAAISTIAGVVLGVVGSILGVLLALALTVVALYVAGFLLAGVGFGILIMGGIAAGLGVSGSGLLLLAIALAGTVGCVWLYGRFLPWMFKGIVSLCRCLFQGRRKAV